MVDVDGLSGHVLGDFLLGELLDAGGWSAVYRATQLILGREAVVKVLRQEHQTARRRFLREAQVAAHFDHPNAAHVYAFGEKNGLQWIAMERVWGEPLDRWLKRHHRMPLKTFGEFFAGIVDVVADAHQRGIVHRDLKPSNVMVIEAESGQLKPKLLDFGIAKLLDEETLADPPDASEEHRGGDADEQSPSPSPPRGTRIRLPPPTMQKLTRSSVVIGTPAYMAPEQWNDGPIGPATDLYALGVMAFESITGQRPFRATTVDGYAELHCSAAVPSTEPAIGRDDAVAVDAVLRRALAKLPHERYGDVREFAVELQRALGARRRAMIARRRSWIHRGAVLLLAAVAVAAVQYRSSLQADLADDRARIAEKYAAMSQRQAEAVRGQQALLYGRGGEALERLSKAYAQGEDSPEMQFAISRALQPRIAHEFPARDRPDGSKGRMWSAAWSPDGRQIVATDDSGARIWDVLSHKVLHVLEHGDTVYDARYTPDGTRLLTACGDGEVRVWDVITGQVVRQLSRAGAPLRYFALALSPDRRFVAASDITGGMVTVWRIDTGQAVSEVLTHADGWSVVEFSADGRWLMAGGGAEIQVVEVNSWRRVAKIGGEKIGDEKIRVARWSPIAPRLVVGTVEGAVAIYSPQGQRIRDLRIDGSTIGAMAWSPDGALLAVGDHDGTEQVWRVVDGQSVGHANFVRSRIYAVEFDGSSRRVLASGAGGSVAISDTALSAPTSVLEGPSNSVRTAHFDVGGDRVVGSSVDGAARVWSAEPQYQVWRTGPVASACGYSAGVDPDSRFIAVGCRDRETRVWDTATGALLARLPITSARPAVSTDGERAALARGSTVDVYELPSGRRLRSIAHAAFVSAVAFAASSHDVVSGALDGSLQVTREQAETVSLPTAPAAIDAVGFASGGQVVAADAAGTLRLYHVTSATVTASTSMSARIALLRVSPDSARLVTVPAHDGPERPPTLWRLEGLSRIADLAGHVGHVLSARWVGGEIVTAGGDGAAARWDDATGQLTAFYRGGERFAADATVSPDGTLVIAGGADGRLRIWGSRSGTLLWTMPVHRAAVAGVHFERGDLVSRGLDGDVVRSHLPTLTDLTRTCRQLSAGAPSACGIVRGQ